MPELKPCPAWACQGELVESKQDGDSFYIECTECGMRGPVEPDPYHAQQSWNWLPRALTWTHEPPVVAGEVYLAKGMNLIVFLVATVEDNGTLYAQLPDSTDKCPLSDFVEWAGPIALPIE